jgi:hypothetical protein
VGGVGPRGGGRFRGFEMGCWRGWFEEGVERRVGSGTKTLFWSDPWLGGVSLSVRYQRLFDLFLYRPSTMAEMSALGWEAGGAAWAWRRPLWAWEKELLVECRNLLYDLVLQPNIADQWLWQHDPDGGYTIRGAYTLLTHTAVPDEVATTTLIWHKQVPAKASVLAWR